MNQLKITFTGEVVRRWKEQAKSGKVMVYIAVKVPRGEYADIFRIKARDIEAVKPYDVGQKVTCEAFVGGRDWTNQETKKISYFTDINLYKIEAVKDANADEPEVVQADDVDDLPF